MSLDLKIGEDEFNYTYNVANMWYAVYPDDIGMVNIEGMTGEIAYPKIARALSFILSNKEKMTEPENDWGSWEGFCKFLFNLLLACIEHPNERWRAFR